MKVILLVGLGRSNKEVVKKLKSNTTFFIHSDSYNEEDMAFIQSNKISLFNLEESMEQIGLVVKVPGIPNTHPIIKTARENKIKVVTEIDIAYDLASKSRYVVITGSNGKSTTTMLVFKALVEKYDDVRLAGNIGLPLINEIDGANENTIFVLELSSYQLETMEKLNPEVVVITNIISTHLEYHGTYENYLSAKLKSLKNRPQLTIIPNNDENINFNLEQIKKSSKSILIVDGNELDTSQFPLKGIHNKQNYSFANEVAKHFGVDSKEFNFAMQKYNGLEHRMELIETDPIVIINDSKATNIDSTVKALSAFEKAVVIIGGEKIKQNYDILNHYQNYKFITYQDITPDVLNSGTYYESFESAVKAAYKLAIKLNIPLILSPACPSFGQFKNFEERGRKFKQLIKEK
jgi:UDP-N-acetylmuramoylalanine--D-glutamate ligase